MPFGELPFLLILTLETAIRGVLEHFTKFTGKHLFQSLFSNKVDENRESGTGVFL